MNNLVLYRKYRPGKFDDVVGQEVVVKTLQSALKQKSPAHAYLFVGSRGTGKTSLARLFARELGVTDQDIVEIDAASNRKIEHVRDLKEMVQKLPFESPYAVYIIDEVHMLTTEAFNALLKTLEEPPKHVIFILATTEFDRVPETIRSRCQVLRFETPSYQEIVLCLQNASDKEGIKTTPETLLSLARHAGGSYRDALGLLGHALQVLGTKFGIDDLVNLGLSGSGSDAYAYVEALLSKDASSALSMLSIHSKSGRAALSFWENSIEIIERGILLRLKALSEDIASHSPEAKKVYEEIALRGDINSKWLDIMISYHRELSQTTLPRTVLIAATTKLLEI